MAESAWLADLVLAVHAGIVAFLVLGQALVIVGGVIGWHWIHNLVFRALHLLILLAVVFQTWLGQICPLTTWEWDLRRAAGQAMEQQSFVGYWLSRLIFYQAPQEAFVVGYTAFAAVVLASWWWRPPHLPGRRREPRGPGGGPDGG